MADDVNVVTVSGVVPVPDTLEAATSLFWPTWRR